MERVFGLETEYGITVDGAESVDVVAESIALVRSYTEHGALMNGIMATKIRIAMRAVFGLKNCARTRMNRPTMRSIRTGR